MRALVVSDLHANAEALRAVHEPRAPEEVRPVICLGDFVGYGAQPNQVLDMMRTMRGAKLYIRGNHDRVAAGLDDGGRLQPRREGRRALDARSPQRAEPQLPREAAARAASITTACCSATARRMTRTSTCSTTTTPRRSFARIEAQFILYGHTHLPVVFSIDGQRNVRGLRGPRRSDGAAGPGHRYLINPGSVGQPRDRNPDASFADLRLGQADRAVLPRRVRRRKDAERRFSRRVSRRFSPTGCSTGRECVIRDA